MPRVPNSLALICIAVLCTILTLGLWPFRAPANGVTWLANRNGLSLGRYSTVLSSGPFRTINPRSNPGASLEIWLQPHSIWDSGTVLLFYKPQNSFQFSVQQVQNALLLRKPTGDEHIPGAANLQLAGVFRKPRPTFITVTAGVRGASIYVDGALATAEPRFRLSASDFNNWVVLGDSTRQPDSWRGQLFGFAIYGRQLDATQVFHNYVTWKQRGSPGLTLGESNIALYTFDQHTGRVVPDHAQSGVNLYIPKKYQVIDKIALEPIWTEFSMTRSYWSAALKNIVGFIPFGMCFYAYLSARHIKRAMVLTVALGTSASLTIEIMQAFLPTRDSGTTDLITNALGTWIGVISYRVLTPTLARFFGWLPLTAPHK